MFHKVLAAMDMSKVGKRVFDQALDLAEKNGASLMLLHILSPDEEGCPDISNVYWHYYSTSDNVNLKNFQDLWQEFSQKGLECLRSRFEIATAAGVHTEYKQVAGSPGKAICETACTWDADLIVIGRRGLSGLSETFMGSVSNYVIHHAHCSVLTVQSQVKVVADPRPMATRLI
ncbi:UspA protein domain protein (plasmid) [Leptolyngbya sp. NIES-3755]|nr:UspA protein domain protein [Leptolyngbya sp. NIES-3755]